MDEKLRFVFDYERDEHSMVELCSRYGICRDTGYEWLRRYRLRGVGGLLELNRAARQHPNQTDAAMERAVLDLREAHMRWGPRKLKRILERDQPGRVWPAASTIGEIVKRAGLVVPRKKRRRTEPYTAPLAHAGEANRVWCADFKGWFKAGDGARVDPLTITDAWSRYLLRAQAVEKTDTERVRAIFEAAFREHGMPEGGWPTLCFSSSYHESGCPTLVAAPSRQGWETTKASRISCRVPGTPVPAPGSWESQSPRSRCPSHSTLAIGLTKRLRPKSCQASELEIIL
jgi:transposase